MLLSFPVFKSQTIISPPPLIKVRSSGLTAIALPPCADTPPPAVRGAVVRAKGDRPHPARMPFKSAGALPVLHVRQTDRIVRASTSHTLPVRAKSHSINRAPVTCDNSSDFSGAEIPQTQSLVLAAASESFTVPAQSDRVYSSGVAAQSPQPAAGSGIPQANSFVIAAASESFTVPAKSDGVDGGFVSGNRQYPSPRLQIPDNHILVVAPAGQKRAVRAHRHRIDRFFRMHRIESPHQASRPEIPNSNRPIACGHKSLTVRRQGDRIYIPFIIQTSLQKLTAR